MKIVKLILVHIEIKCVIRLHTYANGIIYMKINGSYR